jgi:hypothetical protein
MSDCTYFPAFLILFKLEFIEDNKLKVKRLEKPVKEWIIRAPKYTSNKIRKF